LWAEGARRLPGTRIVLATIVVAAAAVLGWAVAHSVHFLPVAPAGFWAMGLAALIVDIPLFGMARREEFRARSTLSVCFTFAIFALWGAGPAILVQAVASAVSVAGQRYPRTIGLYMVARLICATATAEVVVTERDANPLQPRGHDINGRRYSAE